MSISEVIGMNRLTRGGVVIAALGTAGAAIAQASSLPSTNPQTVHARRSFFTSNEPRTEVPAHVQRMFERLDLNHDGFVTREELTTSRTQFEARVSKSAPRRASRVFDRLDANHDGQITRAEADAVRAARLAASGKQTGQHHRTASSSLFLRADANKDGIATRAEYDAAVAAGKIKTRHANMRGSAIARLFEAADVNKDGRVSLEEAQRAALQHFDAADVNHDGTLTPDERRRASKADRVKRPAG
jgi:Ca2+-binding EF-hand superfamily protein